MPPLETYDLHQTAVYWEYAGEDVFGETITLAPVEIRCRWMDGEVEVTDPLGNKVKVQATVLVEEDIEPKSILRLGTLSEYLGTGTDLDDDTICRVEVVSKIPSIDAKYFYRSLGLVKYGGKRPIVE